MFVPKPQAKRKVGPLGSNRGDMWSKTPGSSSSQSEQDANPDNGGTPEHWDKSWDVHSDGATTAATEKQFDRQQAKINKHRRRREARFATRIHMAHELNERNLTLMMEVGGHSREEAKEVKDPNGDCGKQRRWYRGGQASPLALPEPRLVGAEGSAHPWNRPS